MKKIKEMVLKVKGMDCNHCALTIKSQLEKHGYKNVVVNFATSEVFFLYDTEQEVDKAIQVINRLGYKSFIPEREQTVEKRTLLNDIEYKFYFSLFFTLPLVASMFIPSDFLHHSYVQLILCIPVYFLGMWHFGRSAYYSVRMGIPNMDVLITLGSSAAFFYSFIGTVLQLGENYMFYETSAGIISLIFLGNLLEHKAVEKTTSAIDELMKLQKAKTKLITKKDNTEQIIEIESTDIRLGDLLLVNTGDQIPVDAQIVWGSGSVDESLVTGESLPVEKYQGSLVIGGSLLLSGNIKIVAKATVEDSMLGQIIDLVKKAQQDKPPLQNIADKISAVFVPVVVVASLLTFLFNFWLIDVEITESLLRSIAVLVVACPCALGLAIPTAVVVGIGRVAKKGILIKGGSAIQTLASIKNVVFDKTGTLTKGNFIVEKITTYQFDEKLARSLLYSLEKYSDHPLAVSLTKYLQNENSIELFNVTEEKGIGISANDKEGNTYKLGSYRIAQHLTNESHHSIYLTCNHRLIATVDLYDEIKPEAFETIDKFKKIGIKTILLSGDKKEKCEHLASKLKMDQFFYEKLPSEKLEIIEQITKSGKTAMVGDGINDAPALTKADVGISLSNATRIAIKSAQVILLHGRLDLLHEAYLISKNTMSVIKQNLFWAFFYNILAIPIAAAGFLNPMIAAISMALSDVIVVLNSLRLKYKKL